MFQRGNDQIIGGLMRVGRTPKEQAAWLLRFAETDMSKLDTAGVDALVDELAAFLAAKGPFGSGKETVPSDRQINSLFAVPLRTGLNHLRDGHPWEIRNPKLKFSLTLKGEAISGSAAAVFEWEAREVIKAERESLKICSRKGCGRWFIAQRSSQVFCSTGCGQYVHNRSYLDRLVKKQQEGQE